MNTKGHSARTEWSLVQSCDSLSRPSGPSVITPSCLSEIEKAEELLESEKKIIKEIKIETKNA